MKMSAAFGKKTGMRLKRPPMDYSLIKPKKRSYRCAQCRSTFGKQAKLIQHTRTHSITGDGYQCQYCNKVLARRPDRQRHEKGCEIWSQRSENIKFAKISIHVCIAGSTSTGRTIVILMRSKRGVVRREESAGSIHVICGRVTLG